MRFLPGNAQHIGARQYQQDSFAFADPGDREFIAHGGFLAIVCDGMGGMEHGDAASRTAVKAFLEAYSRKSPPESIPAALERSVQEANRAVVDLARAFGRVEGIGTTLVAAALDGLSLYYVSVGDSGLFLVSGGHARLLTHPHVYANRLDQAVARGQLTLEAALAHPERESLTSYIGTEKLEEIDRNLDPWRLQDGDTILLASDGMFKTLGPQEIEECLHGDPSFWPEMLVRRTLAEQREYQDNVTVLSVTAESESTLPGGVQLPPRARSEAPSAPAPETRFPALAQGDSGPALAQMAAAPFPLTFPPQPHSGQLPASLLPAVPAANDWTALAPTVPPAAFPPPDVSPSSVGAGLVKRSAGPLVALIVLLLIATGAGSWWYWTHRRPPSPSGDPQNPGTQVAVPPSIDPNQPVLPKPGQVRPLPKGQREQEQRK
jgi:serine/threonine protein phosphatase PrpC